LFNKLCTYSPEHRHTYPIALWLIAAVSLLKANPGRELNVSGPEIILNDSFAYGSFTKTYEYFYSWLSTGFLANDPKYCESITLSLLHYDLMNLVYPDQIL